MNIHPSLLPKHKGLNPHQKVLDAGENMTGATLHIVTPEVDSGRILASVKVPVEPGDTAKSLGERVLKAEHFMYPRVLKQYIEIVEEKNNERNSE